MAKAKRASSGSKGRHVALLRGINVGGKHSVPMPALAKVFERAGCTAVETYIQSGNVVFGAPEGDLAELAAALPKSMEKAFGFSIPLVVRSAAEIAKVEAANPFLRAGADPSTLHVAFLRDVPTKAAVAALDPSRSPGDELAVVRADVFLRLPHGVARTKLTNAWLDSKLGTVSTVRNWRTVLTLVEMSRG